MITALAILGWSISLLLAALFWGARKANSAWRKAYQDRTDALHELERKHLCATMDKNKMEWLSSEVDRLQLKCHAICAQIRKMKGRGKSGVNPMHNF